MGRTISRWLALVTLLSAGWAGAAWAGEVDLLIDKLIDKGILTPVEAGQIRREISESKEAANKQLAKEIVPESARNWKWKGDLRLRNEYRDRINTGTDSNRLRIRFRYGFEAKINDQLMAGARIATGSGSTAGIADDPISTNQSFETFLRKKPIYLDLAYLTYSPEVPGLDKSSITGGIFENPLWTVGPMVWDGDLSWDGAAVKLSKNVGPVTFFSNNAYVSLDTDESEPAGIWATQAGASILPFQNAEAEVLKNLKLTGAIAYHDYRNTANSAKAGTDPITRESDNTVSARDFNQLNPSLEVATSVAGYPVAVFGDWVRNIAAGANTRNGFMYGAKIGKATTPWSVKNGWEAGYFYERLESDAVFDEFADSDFGGGGTNRQGHVWWLTLATLKNSTLGAKVLIGEEVTGASFQEKRVQMDWVTKF